MVRAFLAFITVACFIAGANAEPRNLTAAEISDLLSGNTAVGSWYGTAYRQHFASNGFTAYAPASGRIERGQWRVNPDTDKYESKWQGPDWSGYGIAEDGGAYHWVSGDGSLQSFTVVEGNRLQSD